MLRPHAHLYVLNKRPYPPLRRSARNISSRIAIEAKSYFNIQEVHDPLIMKRQDPL